MINQILAYFLLVILGLAIIWQIWFDGENKDL